MGPTLFLLLSVLGCDCPECEVCKECEEAPVPDPTPPDDVVQSCCTISDGPWQVTDASVDANGTPTDVQPSGRLWAFNDTVDLDNNSLTRDWYEYAEFKTGEWTWMSSTRGWVISVPPTNPNPLPHKCNASVDGYAKCQEFDAFTSVLNDPTTILLSGRPAGGDRERLTNPSTNYHAEGRYQVWATEATTPNPTTRVGWFYSKTSTGSYTRDEAWCAPAGFTFPRRATMTKKAVSWVVKRVADPPAALPTTLAECDALPGGVQLTQFATSAIKL